MPEKREGLESKGMLGWNLQWQCCVTLQKFYSVSKGWWFNCLNARCGESVWTGANWTCHWNHNGQKWAYSICLSMPHILPGCKLGLLDNTLTHSGHQGTTMSAQCSQLSMTACASPQQEGCNVILYSLLQDNVRSERKGTKEVAALLSPTPLSHNHTPPPTGPDGEPDRKWARSADVWLPTDLNESKNAVLSWSTLWSSGWGKWAHRHHGRAGELSSSPLVKSAQCGFSC